MVHAKDKKGHSQLLKQAKLLTALEALKTLNAEERMGVLR